ncbi:MAG: hypothetical protein WAR37_04705 [Candidatus Microsaccharimonas sp.]
MTPDFPTNASETANEKPYVVKATEVIATAAQDMQDSAASFKVVDSYVDDIFASAEAGKITGSNGVYTPEILVEQMRSFIEEVNDVREGAKKFDPYTLIPGIHGLRESFKLLMASDATHRNFQDSLKIHIDEIETRRAELLSDKNIQ